MTKSVKKINNLSIGTVIKSSVLSCAIFLFLTETINTHFPSFLVWYVSILVIVYSIIFILVFFKLRKMGKPSKWLYLAMVAALIVYFIGDIGGILLK